MPAPEEKRSSCAAMSARAQIHGRVAQEVMGFLINSIHDGHSHGLALLMANIPLHSSNVPGSDDIGIALDLQGRATKIENPSKVILLRVEWHIKTIWRGKRVVDSTRTRQYKKGQPCHCSQGSCLVFSSNMNAACNSSASQSIFSLIAS